MKVYFVLKYSVGVFPDGSICIVKTKGGSFQYSADEFKKNTRTTRAILNKILSVLTFKHPWLRLKQWPVWASSTVLLWKHLLSSVLEVQGFRRTRGGGSLKRNLIIGIELRSAHSHQPQKLRSALVTGPTEAQLTYSLPVCTAVLHLSVVCLYLFFSCTSSLCSCQLHNGLTPRDQHTGHDQLPTTLSL